MNEFNLSSLAHLKKLCKIDCTAEEEADILNSLLKILESMKQLNEINTDNVKPCSYVLSTMLKDQMRQDETKPSLLRDQFLANAPDQIGGMIRIPPVFHS